MDSLSPQRIPHKPMTVLQVACKHCNNMLKSSFASWLLEKKFFTLLCKHYSYITYEVLHQQNAFVVGDSLRNTNPYCATSLMGLIVASDIADVYWSHLSHVE
jgi:hypothetical protein